MTDLPEPVPLHAGIRETRAHPAEYAAVAAYVKEQNALEEILAKHARGSGSSGGGVGGKDEDRRPWWLKKKQDKRDKEGGGAGGGGAANAAG